MKLFPNFAPEEILRIKSGTRKIHLQNKPVIKIRANYSQTFGEKCGYSKTHDLRDNYFQASAAQKDPYDQLIPIFLTNAM